MNRYVIPVRETRAVAYAITADSPDEALRAYEAGEGRDCYRTLPLTVKRLMEPHEVMDGMTAYAFSELILAAAEVTAPVDQTDDILVAIRQQWDDARDCIRWCAVCDRFYGNGLDDESQNYRESVIDRARAVGLIAKAAGITALPSLRDECEQVQKARAAGILFDEAANMEAEWSWYVPAPMGEDMKPDPRAVYRNGEWRVYYENAMEALATQSS